MSDVGSDVSQKEGTGQPGPAPAKKGPPRRLLIAVGVVVLVVVAGGAFVTTRSESAKPHKLTGTLVMANNQVPDACNPNDAYADVADGAPISVSNSDDKEVAEGTLDKGVPSEVPFDPNAGFSRTSQVNRICRHSFTITVPDMAFYRIIIGKRAINYSKKDLKTRNWSIILNISPPPVGSG